jgi:hypothetical protein
MDEREIQIAMQRLRSIEEEAKRRLLEEKSKRVIKQKQPPKMGSLNTRPKQEIKEPSENKKPSENKFSKPKFYCKVLTNKGVCSPT